MHGNAPIDSIAKSLQCFVLAVGLVKFCTVLNIYALAFDDACGKCYT